MRAQAFSLNFIATDKGFKIVQHNRCVVKKLRAALPLNDSFNVHQELKVIGQAVIHEVIWVSSQVRLSEMWSSPPAIKKLWLELEKNTRGDRLSQSTTVDGSLDMSSIGTDSRLSETAHTVVQNNTLPSRIAQDTAIDLTLSEFDSTFWRTHSLFPLSNEHIFS